MNAAFSSTASKVAAVVITIATAAAAFWSVGKLSEVTNSGLFGICGPYGDDWSISLQLGLVTVGLVGSPILGILCARRIQRRFPA
jgi:hypothetical protein